MQAHFILDQLFPQISEDFTIVVIFQLQYYMDSLTKFNGKLNLDN